MSTEANKFELLKLDPNNLVELDQWENKLKTLVDENPFVEITDKKTFEEAKRRRTALKSGRTEVQKQDGLIATFLNNFRKSTKSKNEMLVSIVQPHEEKQQTEIDRFQVILDQEKEEKERLENERIEGIKNQIDNFKNQFQSIIDHLVFANIDSAIEDFKKYYQRCVDEYDFQEFDFLFVESVEELEKKFHSRIDDLKAEHEKELEQSKIISQSKLNQMCIDSQNQIDNFFETSEFNLVDKIKSIFDENFNFGELTETHKQKKSEFIQKSLNKIDELYLRSVSRERQRIFDVREGLLDLIFQMTIENFESVQNKISESFQKSVFEENEDSFTKSKLVVEKNFSQKLEFINKELKENEIQKQKELDELKSKFESRVERLEKIGLVKVNDNQWNGFDTNVLRVQFEMVPDEFFEQLILEIESIKQNSLKETERQERIRQDKITMIDVFVNFKNQINEKKPKGLFDNDESIEFFNIMKNHFIEYCDEQITNINKF
ncbi:hypothetical protein HWC99_gp26 [Flavobacterium phage vB_FspS_tant8-1]|uniref:Uncharacterized protein n=1 Tax=Flavobacterium phage vB_FspS_tant8-1 TaxID=2686278 RepID=A0A6B9LG32_9CAUD|nr:hypothetical protein HWC99_gp26 [Flavobacterium phage vB_FspS_tant8-1]QHB40957.1 hypothetical protein tant81_gp026 [Flavobacterium phage vB_FspS_tant8-1]